MIRNLFVAIFFFFGPAILMFLARTSFVLLRLWLKKKQRQAREHHDVIDVTPVDHHRHPNWYIVLVVLVSLASSISVFIYLQNGDMEQRRYVPAYVDDAGKVVPGHWELIPAPAGSAHETKKPSSGESRSAAVQP